MRKVFISIGFALVMTIFIVACGQKDIGMNSSSIEEDSLVSEEDVAEKIEKEIESNFVSESEPEIYYKANGIVQKVLEKPSSRVWYDIAYESQSNAQKLDIYLPEQGEGPFPVIFAIHGGAFIGGDKAISTVNSRMQLQGVNRGYAVVQVNYRLAKESEFPELIYDIKAALRFIKENANEFSLDPNKIAAWGDSAGGSLASLIGTSWDVNELEDLTMGYEGQTSRVEAVVDLYGDIYLDPEDSMRLLYLGKPENAIIASASTYITPDDPPFLIQHGTKDGVVNYQESVDFYEALKEVIGEDKVTLTLIEDTGHASNVFEKAENVNIIFEFLDSILK